MRNKFIIRKIVLVSFISFFLISISSSCTETAEKYTKISAKKYEDKVYASWLGQMIGNIYGLPHENIYIDEPRPDSLSEFKYRGRALQQMLNANGAFSDDDTDIEYMYLLQMKKHGTEPSYAQLKEAWIYHIRERIWLANRAALTSMKYGLTPPITGSKEYNPHWFQIDPQLVNEIWAVTAPGMIEYACDKSGWAARITNDDWGIEPTIHYAAMYAAAFFENDINRLIDIGVEALPEDSRFAETVDEIGRIHARYPDPGDWRLARAELSEKYYINEPTATKTIWNANLNGACSILALLYGKGDFKKTLDMCCAFGFDADNQAATIGGLLGIVHGMEGIPKELVFPFDSLGWDKPFNDFYKNISRYDLPDSKITDIVKLTIEQGENIIIANGGKVLEENGIKSYLINKNAKFVPKLEMSQVPNLIFEVGQLVKYNIKTTIPNDRLNWELDATNLPEGLTFNNGSLTGIPVQQGEYKLKVTASSKFQKQSALITFVVFEKNIAKEASEIIAHVKKSTVERRDKMWLTVGRNLLSDNVSIINDGKLSGDSSVFYSINDSKSPHEDYYGYMWNQEKEIGNIIFRTGPMEENGSWFQSLRVEYLNDSGTWTSASNLDILPKFDTTNLALNKAHFMNFRLKFKPVKSTGIRIIGDAGGGTHWEKNSSNIYYTSITELSVYPPLKE
jgi:ADP-ribosylglycohydrolase/putative Ig domain-containing protein